MPIQYQNHKRTAVADILSPDNGYRGTLERMGIKTKNHMKDNVKFIRDTERKKKLEKENKDQSPRNLYKLPQFREVGSKVFEISKQEHSNDEQKYQYLTKNSSRRRFETLTEEKRHIKESLQKQLSEYNQNDSEILSSRKPGIPGKADVVQLNRKSDIDFITKNRTSIGSPINPEFKNISTRNNFVGKHQHFGKVPDYLEARKVEIIKAKENSSENLDSNCPPGMMLLSENERLENLQKLFENRENCLNGFRSLPFIVETPSQKRKKIELEDKLRQIETLIGVFSKPKVYINK